MSTSFDHGPLSGIRRTSTPRQRRHDDYMALDWLIRTYTPAFLDLANLSAEAQALRDLRRIVDLASAQAAGPVVRAGRDKAAAAGAAAGAAARDAARAAAWDAARDVLKPTVESLQASALDLLDRMIDPEVTK